MHERAVATGQTVAGQARMAKLSEVEALTPEQFLDWWGDAWEVGQHVAVIGAAGSGKTTFEHMLLSPRQWVLALDPKGHDRTLSAYPDFERTSKWPLPYEMRQRLRDGEPVHVIVGNPGRTEKEWAANSELMRRVVRDVFTIGNWTLLADEGILLAHRQFVDAGENLDRLFIAARDRLVSLVFGVQHTSLGRTGPAALPAFSQSTWVAIARTRDERVHDRMAEIVGRPKAEMRGLISALPRFVFAVVGLDPYEPIRLVKAPELTVPPPRSR